MIRLHLVPTGTSVFKKIWSQLGRALLLNCKLASCSSKLVRSFRNWGARRGVGKRSDLQMYGTSKLYNVLAVKEIGQRLKGALRV